MTEILLDALAPEHEVHLVDRRFSHDIGTVGKFRANKIPKALGLWARVILTARRQRPEVAVVFLTTSTFSFMVDAITVWLLTRLNIPIVHYVHTVGFQRLAESGPALRSLVATTMRSGILTVALGPAMTGDVARWVAQDRLRCIPNAVPAPGRARSQRAAEPGSTLLFVSNLMPEKGADTFVRLSLRLLSSRPHLTFKLAGASPGPHVEDSLRNLASPAGASVQFLGSLTASEVRKEMEQADLLVFPSRYAQEAQPLTIIEAMSAGLPVVAFDIGGIRDVVIDDTNGSLVPAGDEDELFHRTASLLDEPGRMAAYKAATVELFDATHSITTFRARWSECLHAATRLAAR